MSQKNDTKAELLVQAYKVFIQNTISLFASVAGDEVKRVVDEIVDFETQLAAVSSLIAPTKEASCYLKRLCVDFHST